MLAVQDLIGIELKQRCGLMYSRFVADKRVCSSIEYVRAKRHINKNITFEHGQYTYGIILGLLMIKPECLCTMEELQYCNCSCYNVVLVQPKIVGGRPLYRDPDFHVESSFLMEVKHASVQIAIFPSQIKKCILLQLEGKQYFCPLPYHINDN